MQIHNNLITISEEIQSIFGDLGNNDIIVTHNLLHSRIVNPQSYITFVGETSSGKSTIINGLFKKQILATKASPTTGTVTQIIINNSKIEQDFYCINKDSIIEKIDSMMFNQLVIKPDFKLLRLQTELAQHTGKYNGLNIFDTPGYNSLIAEHEEVLRSFIPDADIIIHIVNYRMGFNEQDQLLLNSIYEQIESKDTPVLLVINRCPENVTIKSKRVIEIVEHAKDTLHKTIETFLIPSVIQDDPNIPKDVFPESNNLWDMISIIVNGENRKRTLLEQSKKSLLMLLKEQRLNLEEKTKLLELDEGELKFLEERLIEFTSTKDQLFKILEKFSQRWERTLPKLLDQKISKLINTTQDEIQSENKWLNSNSCTVYISGHYLPYGIRAINKDINTYFMLELEQMNHEMEDVANQAIKKFESSVNIMPSKSYEDILKVIINKIGMRLLGDTSINLLANLGGRGGVAAGMGNLAKMGVKRFGNLFGKVFGREVYANIGRIFTKDMIKKLNVAVAFVIEGIGYLYESMTWQNKLAKKIGKSLDEYKEEACTEIITKTIYSIKESNKNTINDLFDKLKSDIDNEVTSMKSGDSQFELEKYKLCIVKIMNLEKELEVYNDI